MCFPFIYNLYTRIRRIDALELCQEGSFQQIYMCPSKRVNSTNSGTGNLKQWIVKKRLSLYIWIMALLCVYFYTSVI